MKHLTPLDLYAVEVPKDEIWKNIHGYEGYYMISNLGRVKSLERICYYNVHKTNIRNSRLKKERILKTTIDAFGYKSVNVSVNSKNKILKIAKLIAKAFIPNPENHPIINHINGVKSDNRIENLEWCTYKHNVNHAIETGLLVFKLGSDNANSKFSHNDILKIKQDFKENPNIIVKDYARDLGVSRVTIWRILSKKTYKNQN